MGFRLRRTGVIAFYAVQTAALAAGLYWTAMWPFLTAPVVLAYSFTALGVVTSELLTPSLSVVSRELLGVSERVAGLTLLALGNSVPDISSTYQAMRADALPLALGELVGAVVFMLTVVVGTMVVVRPIELGGTGGTLGVPGVAALWYSRGRMVKDLGMLALMISLALFLLCDGRLAMWECLVMVGVYAAYVVGQVVGGEPWEQDEESVEEEEPEPEPEIRDPQHFLQQLELRKMAFQAKLQRHLRLNYSRRLTLSLDSIINVWEHRDVFAPAERLTKSRSHHDLSSSSVDQPLLRSASVDYLLYLDNRLQNHQDPSELELFNDSVMSPASQASLLDKPVIQATLRHYWNGTNTTPIAVAELLTVFMVSPVITVFKTLIPVCCDIVDPDQRPFGLELAQVAAVPFLICYVLTGSIYVTTTLLVSVSLAGVLWYFNRNQWGRWAVRYVSVLTFLTCLCVISLIVHTVVSTLRRGAQMLNVSEAILGLTIFAWGNSIGDLVTTITFTKLGLLDIALGACFGGPLLYFLFGVGFDGILVMLSSSHDQGRSPLLHRSIDFEVDRLLIISCISLFITFLVYAALIPMNNWRIDNKIGVVLLTLYVCTTAVNVYLEIS
ncbi:LAME_0D08394g1_1 [Lachancea meyersii CBS 8951]|uniref:LAME_0D08394g1_1 n=1 Tax=Lachancea meyersii CBS 8951 TaxID=1266667 RepID=A0A1G4JB07_9SACH|nr:LAME_0D08394g1_1 [Lachancea meyersii CBS 8951]